MKFYFKPVEPAPFFNEAGDSWKNWTWQMRNVLTTAEDFSRVFKLTPEEADGFNRTKDIFKIATTPYYASLSARTGYESVRRIFMPQAQEAGAQGQSMVDPLAEVVHGPAPRIIHRYSDRVLFLATDVCSVYCRFCTRKRFTGHDEGLVTGQDYRDALQYISNKKGLREVIFSGGDPLTLSNKVLLKMVEDIRNIPHIEIIRIGTRMPVVCPMRVDEELALGLRKFKPVFVMTHFNHPKEITLEASKALELFVDHGVPVFNQSVLLNGINNHPAIIQALCRRLLYLRVKPYYLFQCDPSEGTDHLRTTIESGEKLISQLWGHLSGLAMPTFSLDIPSGGGKTTLAPNFLVSQSENERHFKGWDGREGTYVNPKVEQRKPVDVVEYEEEFSTLVGRPGSLL